MITYRVQPCGSEFILRHPDNCVPLLKFTTQQEVIDMLPDLFKRRKNERCKVEVISAVGQYELTLEFPMLISLSE